MNTTITLKSKTDDLKKLLEMSKALNSIPVGTDAYDAHLKKMMNFKKEKNL